MKALRIRALAVLLLAPASIPAQQGTVAFVNVNVVPMDRERVLQNQTVVVQNGRISALGPAASTAIPSGALRVDGRGKYLMPGLTEMHGHITAGNNVYSPENVLFLYIAGGATTVRGMQGQPAHLPLRQRVESGELVSRTSTRGRASRETMSLGYRHVSRIRTMAVKSSGEKNVARLRNHLE